MGFLTSMFSGLGLGGGASAGAAGALGGAGGMGSGLQMMGSLLSAISSFMPQQTPPVQMPQPVNIGPSTPTPELPANPATVLSASEQEAVNDIEKRRRAAAQQKVNAQSTTLAGEGNGESATINRITLLGG